MLVPQGGQEWSDTGQGAAPSGEPGPGLCEEGGGAEGPPGRGSDPQGEDERCKTKTLCRCTGRACQKQAGAGDTLGQPYDTQTWSDMDFQPP